MDRNPLFWHKIVDCIPSLDMIYMEYNTLSIEQSEELINELRLTRRLKIAENRFGVKLS